jgi:plastocyanin
MRKQLLSFICIGGLSATGLLLWHQPARAADDVRTTDIVSPGPVFAEEKIEISAGQSIKWVPHTDPRIPHNLVLLKPNGDEGDVVAAEFHKPDTRTFKFATPDVFKIRCTHHRTTMNQTITVTP